MVELFTVADSIGGQESTLSVTIVEADVCIRLSSSAMIEFAVGPYVWQAIIDGVEQTGLKQPQVKTIDNDTLIITGKLGPLDIEHRLSLLENLKGFSEVICLHNPTTRDVVIDDIRTGFSRHSNPLVDPYRLVAVPYRRQADGSLHDYSMAEVDAIIKGKETINPICEPAWIPQAPLSDESLRRMRSESWILTDGNQGLLVLKYNKTDIEHSVVSWNAKEKRLVFGGCAFTLHKEPVRANRIGPGKAFSFGQTRYEFFQGGWPEGYALYKSFINSQGHGLTEEYQPQVQWEILYDLGDQRWSRESVLHQAALAKEVGCTRIYLDPGWEIPVSAENPAPLYGSALWDEKRLGPLDQMVKLLKGSYGLELGLWTASRVNCDWQWPQDYFRKTLTATRKAHAVRQGCRNLALLPSAKAAASSVFENGQYSLHQTAHLNDGLYGNSASWIAGTMPAWVEIDLGGEHTISEVCVSNDNTSNFRDRAVSSFRILTGTQYNADTKADTWRVVAEYQQYGAPLQKQMSFSFEPVTARWIRIEILQPTNENVRIDEIEIYEVFSGVPSPSEQNQVVDIEVLQTLTELCMAHEKWRDERYQRLSKLAKEGVTFLMFDFHGWLGACYAADHGHSIPSTINDHVESIYGIARKIRQQFPNVRIEMHDGVWPWGCRYLPSYFRQGLKDGDYDENWAYEFMWNSINDLRSGKALCLYYYNLAYDIPMYLHFNIHADNEQCLVFWWMASTVRHIGFGGRTNAARMEPHGKLTVRTPEQQHRLFDRYKDAMTQYNRLKRYFTHGKFSSIGEDETLHLHTLSDRPGGVLVVFNLGDEYVKRVLRLPLRKLNLISSDMPPIKGATGSLDGADLLLEIELSAESPAVIEIGAAAASGG